MSELVFQGWWDELQRTLDVRKAFEDLDAFGPEWGFVTELYRGYLRSFEARLPEAVHFATRSLNRFPPSDTWEDRHAYLHLLAVALRFESNVYLSVMENCQTAQNQAYEDLQTLERLAESNETAARVLQKFLGIQALSNGDARMALAYFEASLKCPARGPHDASSGTVAYLRAAAAAHEIGDFRQARRHYENSELCMAFAPVRLTFAHQITWFVALCERWGWDGEVCRWEETIRVLDCPEITREILWKRTEWLRHAVATSDTLAFA